MYWCHFSPSVLWHCWFGDRKGILACKKPGAALLVTLTIWLVLWTSCSAGCQPPPSLRSSLIPNKIQNGGILVPTYQVVLEMALNESLVTLVSCLDVLLRCYSTVYGGSKSDTERLRLVLFPLPSQSFITLQYLCWTFDIKFWKTFQCVLVLRSQQHAFACHRCGNVLPTANTWAPAANGYAVSSALYLTFLVMLFLILALKKLGECTFRQTVVDGVRNYLEGKLH